MCKYVGISDIAGKIHGSTNRWNVVQATLKALTSQTSVKEQAIKKGTYALQYLHPDREPVVVYNPVDESERAAHRNLVRGPGAGRRR